MSNGTKEKAPNIASYELIGKLAKGGMGTVYMARRAGTAGFQRLFAIKVIHEHLADSEECVEMFLDEARLSARLHHSNVVPVVDVGEASGRHYVVMDYIEGTSLGYLLKKSPDERPAGVVAKLIADFLYGLHAAHELTDEDGNPLKLVHRDVSPPNVLVGVDGVGRISDFGIAKAEARLTSTRTGLRKGKLAFMAPEQLLDEPIDRRTDIFAAGATLWTALTGDTLFAGNNDAATINKLLTREIPKPSEGRLAPPEVFDEICLKALMRDPSERYATAEEMADDLRDAIRDTKDSSSSKAVSAWVKSVAGKTLDRRKAMVANALTREPEPEGHESSVPSVGGETGHGLSGMGFSGPDSRRTPMATSHDTDIEPEVEEERRKPILFYLGAAALLLGGLFFVASQGGEEEPKQEEGSVAASAPESAAPSSPASPEPEQDAKASTPATPSPEPADAKEADKDDSDDKGDAKKKKTRTAAVTLPAPVYRGPARQPQPAEPEPPQPAPEPKPEDAVYDDVPKPKPAPAPPPADDPVVERNPYLRGKK